MGLVFSAFYSVISAVNTCRTRTSLHIFTNLVGMHIFEEPCECPSSRVTSPEGPSRQAMKQHDFRKIRCQKETLSCRQSNMQSRCPRSWPISRPAAWTYQRGAPDSGRTWRLDVLGESSKKQREVASKHPLKEHLDFPGTTRHIIK